MDGSRQVGASHTLSLNSATSASYFWGTSQAWILNSQIEVSDDHEMATGVMFKDKEDLKLVSVSLARDE